MIPPKALVVLGTSPGLLLPCLAQWMGGRSVLRNLGLSPSSCALDQQKASFVKQFVGLIYFWYCLTRWTNTWFVFWEGVKVKIWTRISDVMKECFWNSHVKSTCRLFLGGWGRGGFVGGKASMWVISGLLRWVSHCLVIKVPWQPPWLKKRIVGKISMILCDFSVVRWFGMYTNSAVEGYGEPPGMYLNPCTSWDKLPTSTGAGFLPSIVWIVWFCFIGMLATVVCKSWNQQLIQKVPFMHMVRCKSLSKFAQAH